MLLYRVALRTRLRSAAEVAITFGCGASLAVLAPLMPWLPPVYWMIILLLIGALISFVHPYCTVLVVSVTFGILFGSLLWQLGLCRIAALEVPFLDWHPLILTLFCLILVIVFACLPGFAGPGSLQVILVPMLGSILLCTAASGLVPAKYSFGLTLQNLLAESPCDAAEGDFQASLETLAAWLCITVIGIALQILMTMNRGSTDASNSQGGRGGDLVASLLPGVRGEAVDGGANLPRPGEGSNERFSVLTKAIFAPDGTDVSHLSENEQKLVEVCRKDEFERDRVLWGGGLI